jgi:hypothetical protein
MGRVTSPKRGMVVVVAALALATGLICAGLPVGDFSSAYAAEPKVTDFYGLWGARRDGCGVARSGMEGDYFRVGKNAFEEGYGSDCKEIEMWLHQGKLRISASCESEEMGWAPLATELVMKRRDVVSRKGEDYIRCGR